MKNSRKLCLYQTYKEDYQLENYLTVIKNAPQRRMFTKFRISNHKLEIEYGRYKNIPREERFCKSYNMNKVEDEYHFAFECQKYETQRNNSHNILKHYFNMNVTRESKCALMGTLISSKDPVTIDLLSRHILTCFSVRDKGL